MPFTVTHNVKDLERDLSEIAREQLPYAAARAINDTGETMLKANRRAMLQVFHQPTRYTLGAFRFQRATKRNLAGAMLRKDKFGQSAKHYLEVQEVGGQRPATGLEKAMSRRLPYAGVTGFITPARRAPVDRFGNLSRAELQRIYSQTGSQLDARNNETAASRKRKRSTSRYFVPKPGQLTPGVWRRDGPSLRKVLNFDVAPPNYKKRFDYYRRATQVADRFFPRNLTAWMRKAIETRH